MSLLFHNLQFHVTGCTLAVSFLLSCSSGTLYAGLCREADYMAAADHQYVPRVYGMYEGPVAGLGSSMRHGIVMELMEGGSLQSFLRTLSKTQSKTPPWPLAFRLAHQVALAMDYLHIKKDLVHMDLKPGNVLLDANFNAKVCIYPCISPTVFCTYFAHSSAFILTASGQQIQ